MAGAPDLFVVCKKCGSEVSPYITECPYCGTRLRKRAPKIEREGETVRPKPPRMRAPSLGPLRSGEIPGIRGDPTGRPWATMVILALSLFGYLVLAYLSRGDLALLTLDNEQWRVATAPFVYSNPWYELVVLLSIGLYGWRLELRHGPVLVVALFLVCGVGADAIAAAVVETRFVNGAPGAALGFLACWAMPDLLRARRGEDYEGDLLGTVVIAVTIGLMPLATYEASAIATLVGGLFGAFAGLLLARR